MEQELKGQLIQALLRFKKIGMTYAGGNDIRMGEIFVMKNIEKCCDETNKNINVLDIHNELHITKPAVSQMLSSLEKRGYISRKINTDDRRKIAATLTEEGKHRLK